ncbi:hypothetical protein TIFTF001_027666 [Ficus carica]|uniref:Uncharacterized protein n=1 Tax=Ficus carica TaxID=3494 RepID=A0AA88DNF9_FICCA|nr:hypothetical protein TIFTF001_027666 [Ficus carica]
MRFAIVGRSEKVVGVAERLEEGEEREGYIEIGTESDSEPEFPARSLGAWLGWFGFTTKATVCETPRDVMCWHGLGSSPIRLDSQTT